MPQISSPPQDVNGYWLERICCYWPGTVLDKCSHPFFWLLTCSRPRKGQHLFLKKKKFLLKKTGHIIPLQFSEWQGDLGWEESVTQNSLRYLRRDPYECWVLGSAPQPIQSPRTPDGSTSAFFPFSFSLLFQGILCSAHGFLLRVKSQVSMSYVFLSILQIKSLSLTWFNLALF